MPEAGPWVPCLCGEFFCLMHMEHASGCECPPVEELFDDPYGLPEGCYVMYADARDQ